MREDRMFQAMGRQLHQSMSGVSLKFSKPGSAIRASVATVITDINKGIDEKVTTLTQICKRREVDPKEVIEAGSDATRIENYSSRALTNAPQANSLLRELEKDLNMIKSLGISISMDKDEIESLSRISNNIELDRKFDLSYDELVQFGF